MPELPEVQTVVSTLRPHLLGRTIAAVDLRRPRVVRTAADSFSASLLGRSVASIERRGKRILIGLSDGHCLCIHMGMTGRLTIQPQPLADRHTHLVLRLKAPAATLPSPPAGSYLCFTDSRRFGGLWHFDSADLAAAGLGPEPLGLRSQELYRRLQRTRRCIKAALLDQKLIAGLGNIYVDEALFIAGLHPGSCACRLSSRQVQVLTRAIGKVLRQAISHRGSTVRNYVDADSAGGGFQKLHNVYGRKGLPCRACGRPIVRMELAGRGTHLCPSCQPCRRKRALSPA